MAVTQNGTASLVIAGGATGTLDAKAALYVTVPVGAIIESVNFKNGGSPIFEDQMDALGAFHTRLTFEKGMHQHTTVMVGKEYTKGAGEVDGTSLNYYNEGVDVMHGKAAVRTTINGTRLPTIA